MICFNGVYRVSLTKISYFFPIAKSTIGPTGNYYCHIAIIYFCRLTIISISYHLMLLSHYPMVQHKIIKTWCTANPAQFPVTHIASSNHPSLNSLHHIISILKILSTFISVRHHHIIPHQILFIISFISILKVLLTFISVNLTSIRKFFNFLPTFYNFSLFQLFYKGPIITLYIN